MRYIYFFLVAVLLSVSYASAQDFKLEKEALDKLLYYEDALSRLQKKHKELDKQHKKQQKDYEKQLRTTGFDELSENIVHIEQELAGDSTQLLSLNRAVDSLRQTSKGLSDSIQFILAQKNTIEKLTTENSNLAKRVQSLQTQQATQKKWEERFLARQKDISELRKTSIQLATNLESKRKNSKQLQQDIAQLDTQIQAQKEQNQKLQSEINTLQQQTNENKKLIEQTPQKKIELEKLQKELSRLSNLEKSLSKILN